MYECMNVCMHKCMYVCAAAGDLAAGWGISRLDGGSRGQNFPISEMGDLAAEEDGDSCTTLTKSRCLRVTKATWLP